MKELSDIFDIARACGGAKKTGKGVTFRCPCHEDRTPSCSVIKGDHAIIVRCFAGCDKFDVLDALRGMGFTLSLRERDAREKRDLSQVISAKRVIVDHDSQMRTMLARKLWADAKDAWGSRVESYLLSRGLTLVALSDVDRTIRFHPNCPRGRDRQPAMICAMRDVSTDEVVAVHRTFLDVANKKDGKPMMLGPCAEAAIKLTAHKQTFDFRRCFASRLYVDEGIETGIGALMLGFAPVWALGSAGAIAAFEPMLAVGELVVLADHDDVGIRAARQAVGAWRFAGWQARFELPADEGTDYADAVNSDDYKSLAL